jgi:hypothetical protein
MSVDPSPKELEDVSLCAQRLWDLDENRLECTKDYILNVGVRHGQGGLPTQILAGGQPDRGDAATCKA